MFKKVFGSRNERLLKAYRGVADAVDALEPQYQALDDEALKGTSDRLKARLAGGTSPEEILPDAFAAVREASRRAQNHRHFPCQLVGGQVLYESNIAEMRTGEGKTIVCHLPSYLKVLQGYKIHVVTVNDYLVQRDADFAKPIFEMLGVSVGYIQANVDSGGVEGTRKAAYACDLTYGTNSEFGFDYLRDNMKLRLSDQAQGSLDYAIIDEVDSILIDEARTPLIISGPAHDDVTRYKWADNITRFLVGLQQQANSATAQRIAGWGDAIPEQFSGHPKFDDAFKRFKVDSAMLSEEEAEALAHKQYYIVQRERKAVQITHDGVDAAQEEAGIGSFYVGANMDRPHLIENALRARVVYEKDKEYVVQNGEVIIVDEFTGRLMHGRQWSDGLHQAVEAKEAVRVKEESQTLATITIQNFFKLYKFLTGMTGTAVTESEEFIKIYKLEVVEIPTNRPVNRVDHNDKIYSTVADKYNAIVEEINEYYKKGRPNDPFILEGLLQALSAVGALESAEQERIERALKDFRRAKEDDTQVVGTMLEAYDAAMGDLARGRPILVGTTSVENSEKLSALLTKRYGIEHEVLNAKQHAREADIVAKAGFTHTAQHGDKAKRGNVTIATNMAGRGTDIKLEPYVVYEHCKVSDEAAASALYPLGTTKCCIHCEEYDADTNCAHCYKPKLDPRFPALGRRVCTLNSPCGLHIVGTERHEARRIDNQLRGRSGRQGDPGSSRFFLSLEDDLLKLFMPDWMLKMMEKLGFSEGTSLEDKRVTKGIERAQKKVEERNFSSRKHLLEWDEPMDYQRKSFYAERQKILSGEGLQDLLWKMIEDSIGRAVGRFLDESYPARCIAEWCRSTLEFTIDSEKLDDDDPEQLQQTVRRHAKSEADDAIKTSLGEYIDTDAQASDWDLSGLLRWSERAFGAHLTQNQLRRMDPGQIEDWLQEAAEEYYETVDLSGIEAFLVRDVARNDLVDWARGKFGIDVKTADMAEVSAAEAETTLVEKAHQAYHEREVAYPVEYIMQRAFGDPGGPGSDNAYAAEVITGWANQKYNLNWTIEQVQAKSPRELADELLAINRQYLGNGKLDQEIDSALSRLEGPALTDWARQRFGVTYQEELIDDSNGDVRDGLRRMGRELMRYELTRLEQFVLLRIYDQAWKDHLLEMDHLKSAIQQRPIGGDQTHPQSQFAIEGRDLFEQMWDRIRENVTDRIFKVRLSSESPRDANAYGQMQIRHDQATGAGFAGAASDQAAAMKAQNQPQKVETIRRELPKVGRNEPCPCGSGKKYKQCHGKGK